MKKTFVFLLAFLYITGSCEATVYLHYCMGKAVSFSFFPDKSLNCQRCGMRKSGKDIGCCKDEQKLLKSDMGQRLTDLPSLTSQKKFITVSGFFNVYSGIYRQPSAVIHDLSIGPPGDHPVPVYLMNRLLLI